MKTTIIIALLSIAGFAANAQTAYKSCPKPQHMPANAVQVFPKSSYTPVGDPACPPCYEYTTKRGLRVMECPNAWFPPEKSRTESAAPTTTATRTYSSDAIGVESQNSYTGNYNYSTCAKDLNMPANATPVYPKSAYESTGNPDCPPCYEYTTKRGLQVMECPHARFVQFK